MVQLKTVPTKHNVHDFLDQLTFSSLKEDAYTLLTIFQETTDLEPVMWGDSIIGFGNYHYTYASKHEGDFFKVGFSIRKGYISLYVSTDDQTRSTLLAKLGKHKAMVSCIHIKRLSDIDTDVLKQLILKSIAFIDATYPPSTPQQEGQHEKTNYRTFKTI